MKPPTIVKEEHTSSDESQIKQNPKTRRHRASVACTACRDRRIRCVVPSGRRICTQCERSNTSCIIKDDDERRRPISRAYVYSLIERIALLEGLLEEQGLAVPLASHPPETQHRPRQSNEILSIECTAMSSSTLQGSALSEHPTTSSPSSSDDQIKDERSGTRPRKRSSIHLKNNVAEDENTKRTKCNSLSTPASLKNESSRHEQLSEATQLSETCELDLFTMPPPPNPTSLWATLHEHTAIPAKSYSTLQTARIENCAYSVWGGRLLPFQSYEPQSMGSQHRDPFNVEHHYINIRSTGGTTNLDFMPLSVRS